MALDSLRFAHRFDQISGSAIREIFKMIAKPGMISFAGGNPAASALPDAECAEIARDVLQNDGKRILQYGATEGYPPLLESLLAYVEQQLGCAVPAVLPVTGSTQAMDLLCKALIDPGDVILVENPSFLGNMQCMRLYQATLVPVESDENGIIPEKLEEAMRQYHPKLLYTIPTFQNPTGITLAADRRKPIAELAAKYHVVVAEDDPYRDLRYAGKACPPSNPSTRMAGSFSSARSVRLSAPVCVSDSWRATRASCANAPSASSPPTSTRQTLHRRLWISTCGAVCCPTTSSASAAATRRSWMLC